MKNRLIKFLVERDIYGQPISVLYKGSDVFKTKMGALCTILTYCLLLINGITLVEGFLDNSRQQESAQTQFYDAYKAGVFSL